MKVFLDTSTLIKKYVKETGSDQLEEILEKVSEIIVAPIYWIELNSALERRLKERTLTSQQIKIVQQEANRDLPYLSKVRWNESLEQKAIKIIKKYFLKTLDSIQLASGILAKPDLFLTSDRVLYQSARNETRAEFI